MIIITENAATMLDAMHAGCEVSLYKGETGHYALIEGHEEKQPRKKKVYGQAKLDQRGAVTVGQDDEEPDAPKRIDAWTGEPGRMPIEDAVMLVRGALATRSTWDSIIITDHGRRIAQARIGDGTVIADNVPKAITVPADTDFEIGEAPAFQMLEEVPSHPRITLTSRRQSVVLACGGPDHDVEAIIDAPVARTIAGFLADVGKEKTDATATFGGVAITLTARDGGAALAFRSKYTTAHVEISKTLAKVLRAYLVELAKGGKTPAVLEPVEVELRNMFVVDPDCLDGLWREDQQPGPGQLAT